jgi:PEP-utilising enzyme, PEP-binding domain
MIGYRGCYRHTREPDLFILELDVLGRVADATHNLRLMIPFVRTAWELERCLSIVQAHPRAAGLPVWVISLASLAPAKRLASAPRSAASHHLRSLLSDCARTSIAGACGPG